jgi:hypothetical protein
VGPAARSRIHLARARGPRVRFELEEIPEGTLLTFAHSGIPLSLLVGMSAGWHAHLDWLRAHVGGGEFEFRPRYRELRPLYDDALAGS